MGIFPDDQLLDHQQRWQANFTGVAGAFRVPVIQGDVQVLDLIKNARDMDWSQFLDVVTSLILSMFSVDPAELGLKLNKSQALLNENNEARMQWSKSRGLHEILGHIEGVFNRMVRIFGDVRLRIDGKVVNFNAWEKYEFAFSGLEPADGESKSKRLTEASTRDKTINEIRAEQDLPPIKEDLDKIGLGDIINNSSFIQLYNSKMADKQQKEQEQAQAGEGDDGDEGVDDFCR